MYLHIFATLTSVLTTLLRTFDRQISMAAHKILKVEQKWIRHIVVCVGGGERDIILLRLILNLLDFSCRFPCLSRSRKSWNHSESLWRRNKSKLMQIYLKAYSADAFSPIGVISSRFLLAFAYVSFEYPEKYKIWIQMMQTKLPQIYFQSASTFRSNFIIMGFSSENFEQHKEEIQFSCFQNSISFSCNLNFKISFSSSAFAICWKNFLVNCFSR